VLSLISGVMYCTEGSGFVSLYHIWNKFYMGKQLLHVDVIGDINLLHILYHVLYFVETQKVCSVLFKV